MSRELLEVEVRELVSSITKSTDYHAIQSRAREILSHITSLDAETHEASDKLKLNTLKCLTLLSLSHALWGRGDVIEALPLAENSLTIAEEIGDEDLCVKAYSNFAFVTWLLANFPQSLLYFEKVLSIFEQRNDEAGVARNLGNIGGVLSDMGDFERALTAVSKACSINERLGNKLHVSVNFMNIGNIYTKLSNFTVAREYLEKALLLSKECGDVAGMASELLGLGNVCFFLEDFHVALEHYKQALAISEDIGDRSTAAMCLGNIGNVHLKLLNYSSAHEYFMKALQLDSELGIETGVARHNGNLGQLYATTAFNNHDFAIAEEYTRKAMSSFEALGLRIELREAFKSLSDLYRQESRFDEALHYYKKFHELYKEIQSEEATKQAQLMEHRRKIDEAERDRQLKIARHEVTTNLLHKTLPPSIAERLMNGEKNIADRYESVSILFADIVGFTALSARTEPKRIVEILNSLFTRFDKRTIVHGVERIKTIGDAYMVVAGVPETCIDHTLRIAHFAVALLHETQQFSQESGVNLRLRIGIHSGEVVAAVVGETKFSYDVWSDAVNTASRMESHGEAGKIHCSSDFVAELQRMNAVEDIGLTIDERGEIDIKGKGMMRTYFLDRIDA